MEISIIHGARGYFRCSWAECFSSGRRPIESHVTGIVSRITHNPHKSGSFRRMVMRLAWIDSRWTVLQLCFWVRDDWAKHLAVNWRNSQRHLLVIMCSTGFWDWTPDQIELDSKDFWKSTERAVERCKIIWNSPNIVPVKQQLTSTQHWPVQYYSSALHLHGAVSLGRATTCPWSKWSGICFCVWDLLKLAPSVRIDQSDQSNPLPSPWTVFSALNEIANFHGRGWLVALPNWSMPLVSVN